MSAARVTENLTALDALLTMPSVVWAVSHEEKQIHLSNASGLSSAEALRLVQLADGGGRIGSATPRLFMGVDPTGRSVFLYVVAGDQETSFHSALQRHAGILAALPAWTLRIIFLPALGWLRDGYEDHVRHELASPQPRLVDVLRCYFTQRRARLQDHTPIDDPETYDQAHHAFGATRYQVLYRRWLNEGDSVFDAVSSTATADAISRGAGRVEYDVLRFSYRHLSPLVDSTRPLQIGAEEGDEGSSRPRPLFACPTALVRENANRPVGAAHDGEKPLRGCQLPRAESATHRHQGRRSLPPGNPGVGTATGA